MDKRKENVEDDTKRNKLTEVSLYPEKITKWEQIIL
jgi:hypothetical protein